MVELKQQSQDAKDKRLLDSFFLCGRVRGRGTIRIASDTVRVFQQMSSRNDHSAAAYSHGHTLLLGYFTGRRDQGHKVSHLPHKWLPLKVFHAFAIYSLAPIRRSVPRENRSSLKVTQDGLWH